MISRLIELAMERRGLVLVLVTAISAAGVWAFCQQSIDAYPDISAQVVQIITTFPGRATEEVERQVTIPVEISMRSVPRVEVIRSRTIFGLSVVQLIFQEGTESYWARQRVLEHLSAAELPEGATAELGPLATAYGEVYRYELRTDGTADQMMLRELNDWVVIPRILRSPGVAEVTNFGGLEKQFTIEIQPSQLRRFGLAFDDIVDSIKTNNAVAGGSVIRRGGSSFVVRGTGSLRSVSEIEQIFVKSVSGTPVYLRDVAWVGLDHAVQTGIYSKDNRDESVEGIVLMRRGENPSRVLAAVQSAIQDLNDEILPDGVTIDAFYNREYLVDSTLETVSHSVSMGITLVLLVLLLFLGRPSIALLVAVTIPFSLLFALLLMYLTGIPIGLLSIGAIDFGIIVDGAIIMAEHIVFRLNRDRDETATVRDTVLAAARDVERPVFFSVMMVMVAYLPLLSLTSIEGLLFRPMALTMVYALCGSLLFALFVMPILTTVVFHKGYQEPSNPVFQVVSAVYRRIITAVLALPWLTLSAAVSVMLVVVLRIVPGLGFEFLPYMDEGVIWVRANFPEGTALEQTNQYAGRIREIALGFEDIEFVSCQSGRNDSGTDPFPPSRLETMIGPKPRSSWKQFQTKQQLIAALGQRLREEFPTTRFNFTQPIIDSVTEDTNGTSANLAVEISGPDSAVLLDLARRTVEVLRAVPGAVDVSIEQEGPQPQLVITPDRALCARFGVRIEDVTSMINTAIGAQPVGKLYEGERRFDIVARFDRGVVNSPVAMGQLPVFTSTGTPIPLAQIAGIELRDGQTIIARQNGRPRMTVRCDILGRDQGGFVRDAQREFNAQIRPLLPAGYHVDWLGMFENLDRAEKHFLVLIPVTGAIIFAMLLMTFRSVTSALLVLLGIPFACVGALVALSVREMHVNVSTGVGFCALFGIAIMDGVLMVRGINVLRESGMELRPAILQGALQRLRPILMTAIVAIFGLLPATLATGLGSDVQRPLATVIVWGLFSSTLLTLFVVPVLYSLIPPQVCTVPGQVPAGH